MTRADILAGGALVLSLAALYVGFGARQPAPAPDYVTKQELADAFEALKDESQFVRGTGFLRLERHSGSGQCRVARESKVAVRTHPDAAVYWLVDNQCGRAVSLTTAERKQADPANTNTNLDDPFAAPPENSQLPVGTSVVSGVIKPKSAFNPRDDKKIDKFRFLWQVNGQNQPDPELEVDYRRR